MTTPQDFIDKWKQSGGAELANSQSFLNELCDLLEVPHPDPTKAEEDENVYVFEKHVKFDNGDGTTSDGRIDLYRKGCFVLESKQGSEQKEEERLARPDKQRKIRSGTAKRGTRGWSQAMQRARQQARDYAQAIPVEHGWPPFLIVADVGYCFDLYADFTQTGKAYKPFPDPQNYRIRLEELTDEDVRSTLKGIWQSPLDLDPSRRSAKVTRELASRLAKLARSLEDRTDDGGDSLYDAQLVSEFLMRCLFTMFAEDVELIKPQGFTELLKSLRESPEQFKPMVEILWQNMDQGGFSPILREHIVEFNGSLFADSTALELNADQLELLIEAGEAEWSEVEPAIFGTLLERALDPHERHKLGAHYTPRAYVERLVQPTIMDPLEKEWASVQATAAHLDEEGKTADAGRAVREFHEKLCETRVLDPACGSGNFLYVSLELMKRLEGEVINTLKEYGQEEPLTTIDPHQFLGIEVNPRAAAITDLVLWIGYLQWHFRTRGTKKVRIPVLEKFHNIECRDAILAWDDIEYVTDADGHPVTRWDGRTTKPHPVTGEEVPDETARVHEKKYINPRKAEWPAADYVVGNPPFIGNKRMRLALGDGYVEAVRDAWKEVPGSADYVMYWWKEASDLLSNDRIKQFGFVTTNSITQPFNRAVVEKFLSKDCGSLVFAVADHPWIDAADGAAVRIAMTVCSCEKIEGILYPRIDESDAVIEQAQQRGLITPRLRVGADLSSLGTLRSNQSLSFQGPIPVGAGFRISPEELPNFGYSSSNLPPVVHRYVIGRDLMRTAEEKFIIDFYGFSEAEARKEYPELFQKILNDVKPQRDENKDKKFREEWWLWGRPRPEMRVALEKLPRYLGTCRTAKHRVFQFLENGTMPDTKLIVFALSESYFHGILSSYPHVLFSEIQGGWLGAGNDSTYNHVDCFETFPFPDPDKETKKRIRELGEQLDAHRKRQQEQYPELTMTGMYNVLEKLRAGEELTAKEKEIHEQGLVSVLKQIHDDLDAAVFAAYGWPADLSDEEILERLVDLNAERAAEEERGLVRWLRPEFQNPEGTETQQTIEIPEEEKQKQKAKAKSDKLAKQPWPKADRMAERFQALTGLLEQAQKPMTADEVASHFKRAKKKDVAALLETLVQVGNVRELEDGRFVT